jgi:uncharacterized protein (TIRG00374 family)
LPADLAQAGGRRGRIWSAIAKAALGLALLAALFMSGQIDLKALAQLADNVPTVLACLLLLLLMLPLAALRWGLLLRALGVSISFVNLLHFVGISLLANTFLPGYMGGDAVRGLYAWRSVGGTGNRIAISVVADRAAAVFALLFLCLTFILFNWRRVQEVPALAALGASMIVAAGACMATVGVLFAAPRMVAALESSLSRYPTIGSLFSRARSLILALRTKVPALLAAFALAVLIQLLGVFAVAMLADALRIGTLGLADLLLAVPLTFAVNAIPLTPGGIGIGEAAFDQICHWLEPIPSTAAYSSIFFAFRIILALTCFPGLISLVMYRKESRSEAG